MGFVEEEAFDLLPLAIVLGEGDEAGGSVENQR